MATRIMLKLFPFAYWHKDGESKRCTSCSSKNIEEKVTDTINGLKSESLIKCKDCGCYIQEWGCGFYNTSNMEPEPWWHIIKTWSHK